MDALALLRSDHKKVSELFEQMQQTKDIDQKRDIFESIRIELLAHSELEETYFYPLFRTRDGFEDLIDEAEDEHSEIQDLMDEIESLDDDSELEERLGELQEVVDHHVSEEEEELFPMAQEVMSEQELNDLGARMQAAQKSDSQAA